MHHPQARKNVEIIHTLSQTETPNRFILVGSLARGVLLGNLVENLSDPNGEHFTDVDAIDRTTILNGQYRLLDGYLDTQPTKTLHPLTADPNKWGFFDNKIPIGDQEPISTFSESTLGLQEHRFTTLYPEASIQIPSAYALCILSNYLAYSVNMPKHHKQISAVRAISEEPKDNDLKDAYDEYIHKMLEKYPLGTYGRAKRLFFDIAPRLASKLQHGNFGANLRSIRGTQPSQATNLYLAPEEVRTTKTL